MINSYMKYNNNNKRVGAKKSCTTQLILIMLFLISIFIIIKNSPATIWFDNNCSRIFLRPERLKEQEILDFLELFCSAYATSYVFYLVVEFYPQRRKNNKMIKVISPKLESIQRSVCQIIAILDFMKEQQNVDNLDDIEFTGETICIKVIDEFNYPEQSDKDEIVFSEQCNLEAKTIVENINLLEGLTGFGYYSEVITDLLIDMKLLGFDNIVPTVHYGDKIPWRGYDIKRKHEKLKEFAVELERVTNLKLSYRYELMTEEEKRAYCRKRDELMLKKKELLLCQTGMLVSDGIKLRYRDLK